MIVLIVETNINPSFNSFFFENSHHSGSGQCKGVGSSGVQQNERNFMAILMQETDWSDMHRRKDQQP
jgi:hypothetical protein